jgi:hypothetical protein
MGEEAEGAKAVVQGDHYGPMARQRLSILRRA